MHIVTVTLGHQLKRQIILHSFIHSLIFNPWSILVGTRAQSGDRYGSGTLHSGQVLRSRFHCFPPHFHVPNFTAKCLHVRAERWKIWARMLYGNIAEMTTSTSFGDLLHAANLQHVIDRFTSIRKEGVLRIYSP
jgi:hypothetical protein